MKTKLSDILTVVQFSRASHQKNLNVLQKYYEKASLDEFVEEICTYLKNILCTNMMKNENVQRTLDFLAQFISAVTPAEDDDFQGGDAPHPLLTRIIIETLKYHDLAYDFVRYNSCLFIRLILNRIGPETNLDNDLCDLIEDAMLERTQDPKASVRLQAVMALLRLQVPSNPDCPVITAFLSLIVDNNALVRAEIVRTIAPCQSTVPRIVNRLRDADAAVRVNAFRRCADFGPKYFKIVERQQIMRCGLGESHPRAKKVFVENLLTKWLNAYGEDYVELLKSLKLDADESDVAATQEVTKEVIAVLINIVPIKNISKVLSLEDKLIPLDKLSSETSTLWNATVSYLRQHDEMEEQLEEILPELTSFSNYIESLSVKVKEKQMEDWEYLDYQATLHNLFEIVEGFDLSDEVGRKTLHRSTMKLLREENLQFKVKKKIMSIAAQVSPKSEDFISAICHIISDIQEPMTAPQAAIVVPDPVDVINRDCQKAELKVKMIKLTSRLEDATDRQEFLEADGLKREIDGLKAQLAELSEPAPTPPPPVEAASTPCRDDPRTACHCLDLLIALLELPTTEQMTPALGTVKDEFVVPLLDTEVAEVNSRVLNCLAVYCFLDEGMVERCVKILSIPLLTYRKIPNYNRNALLISVKAIADLFHQYGESIFGDAGAVAPTSAAHTMRRLYTDDTDDSLSDGSPGGSPDGFHLESIIEVMLDMLDDEVSEIREVAAKAITKMVMYNFPVTPSLITRIVLKWYNPLTANSSDKLQQLLGLLIVNYSNTVRGARDVIAKAIIPILNSIAHAPHTSPLADVDVENLLKLLAAITNPDDKKDLANTHLAMAHMFCYEIAKKKNASIVHHLSKLMLHLEIPTENSSLAKELVTQLEIVLDEHNCSLDKTSKKNLSRFLERVRTGMETSQNSTTNLVLETVAEESISNNEPIEHNDDSEENSPLDSSSPSSANKDSAGESVNDNSSENKKRARRSINSSSASEGDEPVDNRPKGRTKKKLKVCIARLEMSQEPTEGPEAPLSPPGGKKTSPRRSRVYSKMNKNLRKNPAMRRGRYAIDRNESEQQTELTTDSEPEARKNNKKPKLDVKDRVEKCQDGDKNTGREKNGRLDSVGRITRNGSRLSEQLNSSAETILNTILHDISEVAELRDVSSFDSTIASRRSIRSPAVSSKDSSPTIEPVSKKLDRMMKEKSGYSNGTLRRSTRKMRKK